MSMLDRPISEFEGPCDSVRVPVVPPKGECKPFQEVLIELGYAAEASGVRQRRRLAQVSATTPTSSSTSRPSPARGSVFSRDGAARTASKSMRGEPNPRQWEMYAKNNCVFHYQLPRLVPVHAQLEQGLSRVGEPHAAAPLFRSDRDPDLFGGAAEVSPRGAGAEARRSGGRRPSSRERIETYFDPLPFYYRAARRCRRRTRRAIRSPRSRSGRWRCITRGIRRTRGCGRSTRTTISSSIRRLAASTASATATGCGSNPCTARCAACAATAKRSSRARCGPGTRSAKRAARGISRPTPTSRSAAFC